GLRHVGVPYDESTVSSTCLAYVATRTFGASTVTVFRFPIGEPPVHAENLNRSPAAPFCGADPASNTCVVPEPNHSGVPGVHAVPSPRIVRPDGETVTVTRNCSVYVAVHVPSPVPGT